MKKFNDCIPSFYSKENILMHLDMNIEVLEKMIKMLKPIRKKVKQSNGDQSELENILTEISDLNKKFGMLK